MTLRNEGLTGSAEVASLEFPYRMKRLVEAFGGTAAIANALNTSPTKIHEWQRPPRAGHPIRMPNGYSTLCLALLTGVDLNWLFTGNGQPPSPPNSGH